MSKVRFSDTNGHIIEIERVQYTISDTFSYEDSGDIKKSIKIDVDGWMKRSEIKNYLIWSSMDGGATIKRNYSGKISFIDAGTPYLAIKDVYIMSIDETSETWREWGKVKISFSNEGMHSSDSAVVKFTDTVGKKSVDIYNAQLNIIPSVIRKNFMTVPHWAGSFHQETGYEITRIILNGIIPYDSCSFPENIISCFEQFYEENDVYVPAEGDLSDFVTGFNELKIGSVFIENASLVWNIERKIINVNVSFVGPHQDVKTPDSSQG